MNISSQTCQEAIVCKPEYIDTLSQETAETRTGIFIVIPTYNEAENLPTLLNDLKQALQGKDFTIVVVDDNSLDGTADIAARFGESNCRVLVNRRLGKLGIGSAFNEGIALALSSQNCRYILTMDADLSHGPQDVPRLLMAAEHADLVQASRYVEGGGIIGWSFSRRMTSLVANSICRYFLRTSLHDNTTSFRVYSRACAEIVVRNVCNDGYEWLVCAILAAKSNGCSIKEVPIVFNDRISGESKLRARDILRWLMTLTNMLLVTRSGRNVRRQSK